MDILKRNLFFIICGFVGVVGVALSAFGFKSMAEVRNRMGEAGTLLTQISRASHNPVNGKAIDDENKRVAAIRANYKDVVDWAHELNRRPSLVSGVFPKPAGQKQLDFANAYVDEIERLFKSLKSGEPPTGRDISDMREKIKNEQPRGEQFDGRENKPGEEDENKGNQSGLLTDEEARTTASARAALVKATGIYCYASFSDPGTLHVIGDMYSEDLLQLPSTALWDAQRTLWVQQDVIDSLVRVNEEAASKLKEQGVQPWVGVLPIKDVISIRVSDYVFENSEGSVPASAGAEGPAKPSGTSDESFTGYCSKPDGLYDVLQFSVKLVVNARHLPSIIDAICKNENGDYRFYTPLRVVYRSLPPNIYMTDKIYGEDPVVKVVVDFEAYYFADIYRRLMPDAILDELGVERPGTEDESTD